LLPALRARLEVCRRADFCVGYFNLRGWRAIDGLIEPWAGGEGACARVLVGMQALPEADLQAAFSLLPDGREIDQQQAVRLRKRAAEEFRTQLTLGAPTAADEAGLRRLSAQLRAGKVVVKLFLRHRLHAKLYLLHFNNSQIMPMAGILGSSNLTMAGLAGQGELNVDVPDQDAAQKLAQWFEDRWNDRWCLDISDELAEIIDTSWAREKPIPPYYIYLKMAYHLSQEARAGLSEFQIPPEFRNQLFEFQTAAVKIAAHHVNKRRGVLIGDVVGLGKTLMATALAKIFQEDQGLETLIICPKNLVSMWQQYVADYRLVGRVLSLSRVQQEMPDLRRYRLVVEDESHNLRNREGKRFRAIEDYIERNDSRCVLLTATPYNKTYGDLAAQLRLFVDETADLGIRPEAAIRDLGEMEFIRRHQCPVRSLAAFEKSEQADDWRELMRLFMVRRTRSFIQENYAETDPANGRKYLRLADGGRSYFPTREPRTLPFAIDDGDPSDPYARLYAGPVVERINGLRLPRYGLGNYLVAPAQQKATGAEKAQIAGLGRAGQRLMGFCRTNLFKRLESGGPAFIESIERHLLRNYVFLHALAHGLDLPLGTQDAELLDAGVEDEDADALLPEPSDNGEAAPDTTKAAAPGLQGEAAYRQRAAAVYAQYAGPYRRRFKWLRPSLFTEHLARDLERDSAALLEVLARCGPWDASRDAKLAELVRLLTVAHPGEKVLIFTQFADTVRYLEAQLAARGIGARAGVTGATADPTMLAWRFSPVSNGRRAQIAPGQELRVLVATDVLSEGQNLQDAHLVVNYDLPWAIIRLVQRAGRVDRIGQQAGAIRCYSFLPADGVERIIHLRARVRTRLAQNAEVVGTDEAFFEDDAGAQAWQDLYSEKAGILDGEADTEVDLASYAYQIWKNAIDANPG
jgi:superfamily II DNA or RNA helicase